jgi:hypothetical protein
MNFTMNVKYIKRKSEISDGGDNYLFFTTNYINDQMIMKTKKTH